MEVTLISCVIYDFHTEQLPEESSLLSVCVCVCAEYFFILRADKAERSIKDSNPPLAHLTPEIMKWSRRYMSHSSLVPLGLQRAQIFMWHQWELKLVSAEWSYCGLSLGFELFSFPLAVWTFSTAETSPQCPQAPLIRSRASIMGKKDQELHRLTRKEAVPASKHVKSNKKGRRTWRWSDLPVVTHSIRANMRICSLNPQSNAAFLPNTTEIGWLCWKCCSAATALSRYTYQYG